jgi:AhpD family alkylhydroperoxidase
MLELDNRAKASGLERNLLGLVKIRACQILGCTFCMSMHGSDAQAYGECEQRLQLLDKWREASGYSQRERAALAWTEALTQGSKADDEEFQTLLAGADGSDQMELALVIGATSPWSRTAIANAPDEDYAALEAHFTEEQQIKLTLLISAINSWNRFGRTVAHHIDPLALSLL